MRSVLFLILSFIPVLGWTAQVPGNTPPQSAPQVVNQILFYESQQSWTARDRELYEKIKKEVLQKSRISQFAENGDEDFLLSRLAVREAVLFEVTPNKYHVLDLQRAGLSDFSGKEVEEELKQLGLATSLIELKESQLKQKLRFKTWFDLLKRKYQVKIKSTDFKP
jgi:hypothetical protein